MTTNALVKAGAVFFVLWGLLHIAVGLSTAGQFITSGPAGVFSGFGASPSPSEVGPALQLAGHIALDFGLILAGYGLLAIWAALLIWRGQRLGFWLATVMLGVADGAFIVALMVPGFISPAAGGLGPLLYVLGVASAAIGFFVVRPATGTLAVPSPGRA